MLIGAANTTTSAHGPGYAADRRTLDTLREGREARRLARQIARGKWRDVLLTAQKTQHLYRAMERHSGAVEPLLAKVNLVKLALVKHADIVANRPPVHSVREGHEEQDYALDAVRSRCLFDGLFHESMVIANTDGHCTLAADRRADGAVLRIEDNDVAFPVGPVGPDMQPTVWERRWTVERTVGLVKKRYLRVERHRVAEGLGGVVENEAYETNTTETLVDLRELRRVPLAAAFAPGDALPAEREATGLPYPLLTRLTVYRFLGEPQMRIDKHNLDLIDETAAQFSRLSRVAALHSAPKLRVPESLIDPVTGRVKGSMEAFTDDDKVAEYLAAQFDLSGLLEFMDHALAWLLIEMEISPALLGIKPAGGAAPDSFDKLRLESSTTLAAAQRSIPYVEGALARAFTLASMLDTRRPSAGYPVAEVSVRLRPSLPKEEIDVAREQSEMLAAGLTSRQRAIAAIHGEENVDAVMAEQDEDAAANAARQRAALGLELGFDDPATPREVDDPEPTPPTLTTGDAA